MRVNVREGSWFHLTECFGPVLGVMRATSLEHAIWLQNGPEYGLTGGLHSLDPKEIETWLAGVQVGNAYVNRHITGAVVQRQPFGGWKRSCVGAGHKPGGPNHLHGYGTWTEPAIDVRRAEESYEAAWIGHFSKENDPTGLACERNVLRYRPLDEVVFVAPVDDEDSRALARIAAIVAGVRLVIVEDAGEAMRVARESLTPQFTRIRAPRGAPADLLVAAFEHGIVVDRAPLTTSGFVELPHWLLEQSVSRTMHRYGRLL